MITFPMRFYNLIKLALMLTLLVSLWWLVQPALAANMIDDNNFSNPQLLSPHAQCSTTITVTSNGDSGIGTLRQALIDICDGGTIDFDAGLTNNTITLTSDQLTVSKAVTITNPNASNLDINGNDTYRGFFIQSGTVVTISHLAITNCRNEDGGGIFVDSGATLNLDNSVLDNNQARSEGGGLYNSGTITVNNSTFSNNSAGYGGGGLCNSNDNGSLTLNSSTVTTNTSSIEGAGISNRHGTVIINNSNISNNSGYDGGGIFNRDNLVVSDTTFRNNYGAYGGGINSDWWDDTVSILINNSTFDNNLATEYGGGIYIEGGIYFSDSILTLNNSTLSNNVANEVGGGIYGGSHSTITINNSTITDNSAHDYGGGIVRDYGPLHLRNSIIANNHIGGDCLIHYTNLPFTNVNNLIEDGSCNPTLSGDPNLGPLQDNGGDTLTHALLPGSPAIDAGDNASCLATDQRGVDRPQDGDSNGSNICDIGAYELTSQTQSNQAPYTPSNPIPTNASTNISNTQTLSWHGGDPDGDVVTYTISIGTDYPLSVVQTTTLTSYTPSLTPDTTYYWVITATDGMSTSTGLPWQFNTAAATTSDTEFVYLPLVLK